MYLYNLKAIFLLVLLVSILTLKNVCSQNPYQTSGDVDGLILPIEMGTFGLSVLIGKSIKPIDPPDDNLMIPKLNFVDRLDPKVLRRWDTNVGSISDKILLSSLALPVVMPVIGGNSSRHKMGVTYLIALEGMLANIALTDLTKVVARRRRPFTFYNDVVPIELQEKVFAKKGVLKSFFSGHTSVVACNSFLTAKFINDFYPESNIKPYAWATAIIIPSITGYLRVKAGKHFITDVLVGFLVGSTVGWVIPELHKI